MDDDRSWMRHALQLAGRARGTVSPNPLVGCVLVTDGAIVGEGWTQPPGGPHAEIVAMRQAGRAAEGATAYVTLEPCDHVGRTGACSTALVDAGVARVHCAIADPNPLAAGGAATLRQAEIQVETGLLADEARHVNRVFLHGVATERPYVVLKQAMSLDGRIAAADGSSHWLTGQDTRAIAHRLRADADAVLVGIGTVLADDPRLTVRLDDYAGPPPVRVVLDRDARTPVDARACDDAAPTVVITAAADSDAAAALRARGVTVVHQDPHDLAGVMSVLWAHGVRSVLVEGGAAVAGSLIREDGCDELHLHVAPVVLGERGRPWVVGDGITALEAAPRLTPAGFASSGSDVVLTYVPDRAKESH